MESQSSSQKNELFHTIWNSYFIRIICYALLCQFTMSISNTVLPLYVIKGLGMSAADSGLLGTLFTVGSMACRIVSGYISDRFGRRFTLILGAAIVAFALIMLGFQTTLVMLLIFKVIQGIGNALHSTTSNAVAAEVLPQEKVGQGLGYYSLHSMITNAIGPTLCLALMGVGAAAASGGQNYRLPMLVGGGMGIAACLIAVSMNYEKKLPAARQKTVVKPKGIKLSDLFEKRAIVPAILMFFVTFANGATTYMIVFANEYHFNSIAYYYIINALVGVGVRFLLGSKLDSIRPRKVAMIAISLKVLSFLALGLTLSEWSFILSAFLLAIFNAMLTPMLNAMAMKLSPESRRGAASSTYWLGFDIGMAIGMFVFGAIIDWGGYTAAFLVSAAYMFIFAIVAFFILKKYPPTREITSPVE